MQPSDALVVGDASLAAPPGVLCIDLAVAPGLPGFLDVVGAIAMELEAKRWAVPAEMLSRGAAVADAIRACFPEADMETVGREELKKRIGSARAVVRTGDIAPYANVIIYRR